MILQKHSIFERKVLKYINIFIQAYYVYFDFDHGDVTALTKINYI